MLRQHLAGLKAIEGQSDEDRDLARGYRNYLLKEARGAYIEREARTIRLSLNNQDVDILSASARQYSLCLEDAYDEDDHEPPKLTPKATGIPQLRRYLFRLPAQTNYRALHHHVFETLPDIVGQIQRILEKFDDEGYSEMREHLAEQLPLILKSIQALAHSLPAKRAAKLFDRPEDKSRVNARLKDVVKRLRKPDVYYPTFQMMLKWNGIPGSGAGYGKNLNEMILNGMIKFIDGWHEKMQNETESIAARLDEPIHATLKALQNHCNDYDGDPELKRRATDLLETATRRIAMAYGKLAAQLQSKLRELHLLYTTETNYQCPIALEMRGIYRSVSQQQRLHPGRGSYDRQRAHLLDSLISPDWPMQALPDIMEEKIRTAQIAAWRRCCKGYVTEAMALLQDFSRAIDELHDSGAVLASGHRRVREKLERQLPYFKQQLIYVQAQFRGTQAEPSSVSGTSANGSPRKRKADAERAATQPPTLEPDAVKRIRTTLQSSQLRAVSVQPVARFGERLFLARMKQAQESAIKREWSP